RLSATTGLPEIASSWSYSARICRQSVSAAVGASLWTALIAAWIWYGPGSLRRRQRRTSAWPSAIRARSHAPRSWSASRTRSPPAVVRAGRRASISSMSASRPRARPGALDQQDGREQAGRLGLVGHELREPSPEPDRLGAEVLADEAL